MHRANRDRRLQCNGRRVLPAAGVASAAPFRITTQFRLKVPEDPKNRQFLQLNRYRRERTAVHVYLLSGTRFTGRIRSFDVHTVLLETQHGEMVIYGHAISTIEPATGQRGRRPAGPGAPRAAIAATATAGATVARAARAARGRRSHAMRRAARLRSRACRPTRHRPSRASRVRLRPRPRPSRSCAAARG
jgi:host factor-I protein